MDKQNNISKIYESILNRLGKIVEKKDIESIIKEFNKTFKKKIDSSNAIKYLSRHNYIKRLFLKFYYINSIEERQRKYCKLEDRELLFSVLNKLDIEWYLGLSSALYESGKIWQAPVVINIVNNKFSGKKIFLAMNIRFYKIKEKLIFSLKKGKTKNNIDYFYSDTSKSYLDMFYLGKSEKLIADKYTKKYLKKFPKWVEKKST